MPWRGLGTRPWLIVPLCAIVHITYAICYLINVNVGQITALHVTNSLFGRFIWVAFIVAALASLVPMFVRLRPAIIHLYLWPQQFMLFLMAISAMEAAVGGSYPDGTVRSHSFIYADQCLIVYLAIAHFIALYRNAQFPDGLPE